MTSRDDPRGLVPTPRAGMRSLTLRVVFADAFPPQRMVRFQELISLAVQNFDESLPAIDINREVPFSIKVSDYGHEQRSCAGTITVNCVSLLKTSRRSHPRDQRGLAETDSGQRPGYPPKSLEDGPTSVVLSGACRNFGILWRTYHLQRTTCPIEPNLGSIGCSCDFCVCKGIVAHSPVRPSSPQCSADVTFCGILDP